jgi:hypothetical protein
MVHKLVKLQQIIQKIIGVSSHAGRYHVTRKKGNTILAACCKNTAWHLGIIDLFSNVLQPVAYIYTSHFDEIRNNFINI